MFTEYMTPPLTMKIDLEKGHKAVEIHSILASFFASRNISVLVGKTNSQKIGFQKADIKILNENLQTELKDPVGDISTLWV